tara:strand:+ start:176 stop:355 length:180 start_codon:yes stop_codon:yes gene_type:complete
MSQGKSMKRKEIDEAKFPEYNKLVIELVEEDEDEEKEEKYKQLEFDLDYNIIDDQVAPI